MPVASATRVIPPRPMAAALVAAQRRRRAIEDGLEGLVLDLEALDGGGVHESERTTAAQRLDRLFLRAA